ncbi:MAG: polysaccharide biosynthesis tyrosine autokinase, partial [Chthoniobacteraceae bacterium]
VLLMILSILGGLNYYVYHRPMYYAKALVRPVISPLAPESETPAGRATKRQEMARELQSAPMVEQAAKQLRLPGSAREIQTTSVFRTRVRPNQQDDLEVEVWAAAPDLANRWTQALADGMGAARLERRAREARNVTESYTREVRLVAAQLGRPFPDDFEIKAPADIIGALEQLRAGDNLPARLARLAARLDELDRLRAQLADPGLDTATRLMLLTQAGGQSDAAASLSSANERGVAAQAAWAETVKERDSLALVIVAMIREGKKSGSQLRNLQKQLRAVDDQLQTEMQAAQAAFNEHYDELKKQKAELESKLAADPNFRALTVPGSAEPVIVSLSQAAWERMAAELQRKLSGLEADWDRQQSSVTYLWTLTNAFEPVWPKIGPIMIVALSLGLVLAAGVPLLLAWRDDTYSSLEEVENAFGMRGLGVVPDFDRPAPLARMDQPPDIDDGLVENFHLIRGKLVARATLSAAPHLLMVTSATAGEGKTMAAAQLASAFAQAGARTLLVDGDLHGGVVHRLFGRRRTPGLVDVLLEESGWDHACRSTRIPNLWFLAAGTREVNGAQFMQSSILREGLEVLRKEFDHVIIDAPAVLGRLEAVFLQRLVDGVVVIISSAHTPVAQVETAMQILTTNGANIYGFILNRLDPSATRQYFRSRSEEHQYVLPYATEALKGG